MDNQSTAARIIGCLILGLALSFSSFAQPPECAEISFGSDSSSLQSQAAPIRASIEEISSLTGISIHELEWATATNPLFTVVLEDQVIPYHEFGPEVNARLSTRSGLLVTPQKHGLLVESNDGQVSRLNLNLLLETESMKLSMPGSKSEDARTEWLWVVPIVGAGACWAAAQHCFDLCAEFIRGCECGGECNCGSCGQSSGQACYTCPWTPPRDSAWF